MPASFTFDPAKVAYFEKAGWEAYYDRKWLKCMWLMVQLCREEFRMSLPNALAAAIDIVRATIAFAPLENNDIPKATAFLERFYQRACRSVGIQATPKQLADLEMTYWVVHRQLAIQRKQNPDQVADEIEPMIEALARLHAALFNSDAQTMRTSATLRAQTAKTVDRITGRYSSDVAADWQAVERYLRQGYEAVRSVQ